MAAFSQQLPTDFVYDRSIIPPRYHQLLQSSGLSGFETVLLKNLDELQEFKQMIAVEPQTRPYVKELHLDGWGSLSGNDQRPWIDSIPHHLAGQLSNLKSIHFELWDESYLNTQCILGFGNAFPTVDTLRFSHCTFAHFRDFEEVLLSFPALSHLSVYNLNGFPEDDPNTTLTYLTSPNPRRRDVRLKYLHIAWGDNAELLFAWLRLTACSLRSLRLDRVSTEDDARAVTALLQTLGPELRHLTIGCVFNVDTAMRTHFDDFINISGSTGLVSLRLLVDSLDTYDLPWVSSILAQLASRRIAEVALEVPLFSEEDLENTTWSEIVAKLRELNLRKLEVVHCGQLGSEDAEAAIQAQFSLFFCPDVLHIVDNRIAFLD
ncbi:hypothetical protein B0H21DRAFT_750501 [Amylocystis lapponica]|nr:hypothetical protein B0H21DRAFT_750501 [Amylocystis lapponica]